MHTELAVALLSRMIWLKAGLRVQVLCLLVRHVSGASDGGGHVPADGGHWAHAGHCHLHGLHCCPHCRHHVRLCGGLPTGMLALTPSHCMRGGQCFSQNKQFSPGGSDHYRHHVWPCGCLPAGLSYARPNTAVVENIHISIYKTHALT